LAIITTFGTTKFVREIPFSAASGFRELLLEGNITDVTHTALQGSSFVVYKSK